MKTSHFDDMYRQESYYWWHVARRRIVSSIIKKNLPSQSQILDIGCGTGKFLEELSLNYIPLGTDINQSAISYAKKRNPRLNIKKADIQKQIPFKKKFDAAVALDVLEHLKNDSQALKHIYHALKPGGLFIITVPAIPWLYSYWDQVLNHQRRYSKSQLTNLLTQTGFHLIHVSYFNTLLFFPQISFRILKGIIMGKKAQKISDFHEVPSFANQLLKWLLELEGQIALKISLPIGLSLIAVAKKA